MRSIEVADFFNEAKMRVSSQHASEVVRSPDDEVFFAHGNEVPQATANGGLHIKSFGRGRKRYSVIVLTGMGDGRFLVQAAFRIPHSSLQITPSDTPFTAFRKFLEAFGVNVTLPGLGGANLFFGGELKIPASIATDGQAMAYLYHIADGQTDEAFAMLTNFRLDHASSALKIHLIGFYATERYLEAPRGRKKPHRKTGQNSSVSANRAAVRAEYKRMLMASGYQPECIDAEWSKDFALECERVGLRGLSGNAGDVVTYQGVLDRASALVEHCIRERGHELKHAVYVAEWPLGEIQASVHHATPPRGALVLVNVGLMALVHHMSKLVTNSLNFVYIDGSQVSFADEFGWPPLNWTREDAAELAGDSLAAYFVHGDCRVGRRIPLPDASRAMFASALTSWAETFVVAHEYAHLLLEHDGRQVTYPTLYGDIEAIGQSQQNEYDADLAAIDLCLATANWSGKGAGELDVNLRVGGACLFFLVVLFLDGVKIGPHDFTVNKQNGSHPSPFCRMTNILDHLKRRYGGSTNLFGEVFRQLAFSLIPPAVERAQSLLRSAKSAAATAAGG